jgi:hypothetical protein
MNINDLTIGQVRELTAMIGSKTIQKSSPFIGRHVIVRAYSAGVHAGELVSQDGDIVVLKNSRRLWNWKAKSGVALSGVAVHGIDAKNSKLDVILDDICIIGVCEIIPTSSSSQESIKNA